MATTRLSILLIDNEDLVRREAPPDLIGQLSDRGIVAIVETAADMNSGIQALQTREFHAVMVDLRLARGSKEGNEIIRQILMTRVLPIIVYTGYVEELEAEFAGHEFIWVSPAKKIAPVAAKIYEWHASRVFEFFSESGFVGSAMHRALLRTMWRHLSRYWGHLDPADQESLVRTAGRITATLFHDELTTLPEFAADSGEVPIHHGEIFIFDSPRKHLAVGDVLNLDNQFYAVVTPTCDLVPRKSGDARAELVLLARGKKFRTFVEDREETRTLRDDLGAEEGSKRRDEAVEKFEHMMRHGWQNHSGRLFFLPPFGEFPGLVVDFLDVRTEPIGGSKQDTLVGQRVTSLNREVAAELATRFARYMSRLGQAPYAQGQLMKSIIENI